MGELMHMYISFQKVSEIVFVYDAKSLYRLPAII